MHYEKASERWSPVQGVRSVLMSVLSMLAEPNVESGANIEVSSRRGPLIRIEVPDMACRAPRLTRCDPRIVVVLQGV